MLQRIQSVYLLAAVFVLMLFLFLPVGSVPGDISKPREDKAAIVITSIVCGITLINVFMYKNRKRQYNLCWVAIAAIILLILETFLHVNELGPEHKTMWGIFALPFAMILQWLASKNIAKDEKLVKDMDRLR